MPIRKSHDSVRCICVQRRNGFTLIELLIALVILTITMLLLFSGLRLGSRAWETVEEVSDQSAELRLARNFIERSLRQARGAEVRYEGQAMILFAGTSDQIEFVAPLSAHVGIPGLYVLRLGLEDSDGDTQRLVLTRWLLHPDVLNGTDDAPAWEPLTEAGIFRGSGSGLDQDLSAGAYGQTLMLPRVGRFELSYYGAAEGLNSEGWYPSWIDQDKLPSRVKLDLTMPDQDWPIAIIPLPGPF